MKAARCLSTYFVNMTAPFQIVINDDPKQFKRTHLFNLDVYNLSLITKIIEYRKILTNRSLV